MVVYSCILIHHIRIFLHTATALRTEVSHKDDLPLKQVFLHVYNQKNSSKKENNNSNIDLIHPI